MRKARLTIFRLQPVTILRVELLDLAHNTRANLLAIRIPRLPRLALELLESPDKVLPAIAIGRRVRPGTGNVTGERESNLVYPLQVISNRNGGGPKLRLSSVRQRGKGNAFERAREQIGAFERVVAGGIRAQHFRHG